MVTWNEFRAADPDFAARCEERVDGAGLVLVGTLRQNGWPRISSVEPLITDGSLYLGMMWQSKKALDLLSDPRCVVHSTVADKSGTEGDVKIYGRAVDIVEPDERERYAAALYQRIGWRPEGDFHLFAVDIEEVGYFRVVGEDHEVRHWRAP
jgi:hypothetical protein